MFTSSTRPVLPFLDVGRPLERSAPLNRGLMAWWITLPQSAGGAVWRDLVRSNHFSLSNLSIPATTTSGITRLTQRRGGFGELRLNGTSNYVVLSPIPSLYITDRGTISCWVKLTAATATYGTTILTFVDNSLDGQYSLILGTDPNGTSFFGELAHNYTDYWNGSTTQTFAVGSWYHVVLSGGPAGVTLYVNGAARTLSFSAGSAASTEWVNQISSSVTQIKLGLLGTGWLSYLNGGLDDIRLYNRQLSAGEVEQLYRAGQLSYPSELRRVTVPTVAPSGAATPAVGVSSASSARLASSLQSITGTRSGTAARVASSVRPSTGGRQATAAPTAGVPFATGTRSASSTRVSFLARSSTVTRSGTAARLASSVQPGTGTRQAQATAAVVLPSPGAAVLRWPVSPLLDSANPVDRTAPLNDGLLAWWIALPHSIGGRQWRDLMRRNDVTLTNMAALNQSTNSGWNRATTRQGGFGDVRFNGINNYATLSPIPPAYNTTQGTISAWANRTATNTNGSQVFSFSDGTTDGGTQLLLGWTDAGNSVFLMLWDNAGGLGQHVIQGTTPASFPIGRWYHLLVTGGPAGNALYVNGARQTLTYSSGSASTTAWVSQIFSQLVSVDFGRLNTTNYPNWLTGSMDDVRLYNRQLSAGEVAQLYQASRRGYPQELRRVTVQSRTAPVVLASALGAMRAQIALVPGIFRPAQLSATGVRLASSLRVSLATVTGAATRVASSVQTRSVTAQGAATERTSSVQMRSSTQTASAALLLGYTRTMAGTLQATATLLGTNLHSALLQRQAQAGQQTSSLRPSTATQQAAITLLYAGYLSAGTGSQAGAATVFASSQALGTGHALTTPTFGISSAQSATGTSAGLATPRNTAGAARTSSRQASGTVQASEVRASVARRGALATLLATIYAPASSTHHAGAALRASSLRAQSGTRTGTASVQASSARPAVGMMTSAALLLASSLRGATGTPHAHAVLQVSESQLRTVHRGGEAVQQVLSAPHQVSSHRAASGLPGGSSLQVGASHVVGLSSQRAASLGARLSVTTAALQLRILGQTRFASARSQDSLAFAFPQQTVAPLPLVRQAQAGVFAPPFYGGTLRQRALAALISASQVGVLGRVRTLTTQRLSAVTLRPVQSVAASHFVNRTAQRAAAQQMSTALFTVIGQVSLQAGDHAALGAVEVLTQFVSRSVRVRGLGQPSVRSLAQAQQSTVVAVGYTAILPQIARVLAATAAVTTATTGLQAARGQGATQIAFAWTRQQTLAHAAVRTQVRCLVHAPRPDLYDLRRIEYPAQIVYLYPNGDVARVVWKTRLSRVRLYTRWAR